MIEGRRSLKRIALTVAVTVVALALVSGAAAGGSVVTGHSATPPAAGKLASQATPTLKSSARSGTLPFTGLNLAGFAGSGVLLLGAGLVLRRSARRPR
jgi:hypothetical protein